MEKKDFFFKDVIIFGSDFQTTSDIILDLYFLGSEISTSLLRIKTLEMQVITELSFFSWAH